MYKHILRIVKMLIVGGEKYGGIIWSNIKR